MLWKRGYQSSNVEDRRGMPVRGISLGLGGTLILGLLGLVFGRDFLGAVQESGEPDPSRAMGASPANDADKETVEFVSFVLDDAQRTWRQQLGPRYRDAKLVLFTDVVQSGCGTADAGVGPFYCPADEKVYIDLSFYRMLKERFGAPGDFAQAYVIAHEVGHHVQHVLGLDEEARGIGGTRRERNQGSVAVELQADCLAGVWANSTEQRKLLEVGDVDEAMQAAAAVGDDRLQKRATGRVVPDSFTHGSSAQRTSAFHRGFDEGRLEACDAARLASHEEPQ